MKRKSSIVIYPLLFGLYPFLNLYASNLRGAFRFSELALPIVLTLLITTAVWLALALVWKSAAKSAFVCLISQFLFFSYGHIYNFLVVNLSWNWITDAYLLLIWLFLFLIALMIVLRWGKVLHELTGVLNLVAIVLIIFPIVTIARANHQQFYNQSDLLGQPFAIGSTATGYQNTLPDIYYIILDGYPREDVFDEFFGYDNSTFTDDLRDMGFYVADRSQANYLHTLYSMVSALNADYLQTVLQGYDLDDQSWSILNDMLGKNVLCPTFKRIGYYHIVYDNTLPAFTQSTCADTVRGYGHLNRLDTILLQTTLLRPFWADTVLDSYRDSQQFIFDDLPEVAKLPQPTFTYAHILLPHPPIVFGRDGQAVEVIDEQQWTTPGAMNPDLREAYLDQAIYASGQIETTIRQILANSKVPPIIILQSDHGSFPPTENSFGSRYLRERVPILNAYYLPYGGAELLYPSISPINSFRVVLNYYFGADLPYLEDRTYHTSMSDEHAFDYVDVTWETIYEGHEMAILRSWDREQYLVQQAGFDVIEFPSETLGIGDTEITSADGWSILVEANDTSRHTFMLYNPQGQRVGTGYIDDAFENRYDLEPQDYDGFMSYRDSASPIPTNKSLISPNLNLRIQDADIRSIGSYLSWSPDLSSEDRDNLYDLMILLEQSASDDQADVQEILDGDYMLVKDTQKWRQSTSTEDWFILHNPSHLEHVRTWSINVADRFEPIQYDLYRVIRNNIHPSRVFILPEFYRAGTPIIINSPSLELNIHIRDYLLDGVDPDLVFNLANLNETGLTYEVLAELELWLVDQDEFWYIEVPESRASQTALMAELHSLGYVRGRSRGNVQPFEKDLYYSDLQIFTFHRSPTEQTAPLYLFGQEPLCLHSWSFEAPEPLIAGQEVRLQTWWSARETPLEYYRMSLILTDMHGAIFMQDDLELSEVMMPQWQAGQLYLDERWLSLPSDLVPGEYELRITLYAYNYDTGRIVDLPAYTPTGETVVSVTLFGIQIEPAS